MEFTTLAELAENSTVETFGDLIATISGLGEDFVSGDKIKSIAIFSQHLGGGGIERVVAMLAGEFCKIGYSVCIFTSSGAIKQSTYGIPKEVVIAEIPRPRALRWLAIKELCDSYDVDICLHNDHYDEETYYDILCCRSLKKFNIAIQHNLIFAPLYNNKLTIFRLRTGAYQLLDALVCLTKSEQLWWKACGIDRAVHIRNPLPFGNGEAPLSNGVSKNVVVLNRFTPIKGLYFLPEIIEKCASVIQDIHFQLLGGFPDEKDLHWLRTELEGRKIEKNVSILGFVSNVSTYLGQAKVLLMPSYLEGFCLSRYEANAHGVPAVYFSMPYLEPTGPDCGSVMVGKADVDGMVRETVHLLTDYSYWKKLSDLAVTSLPRGGNADVMLGWEKTFRMVLSKNIEPTICCDKKADFQFLKETMQEFEAAMGYYHNLFYRQQHRYEYLKPVDRLINYFVPRGSRRREFAGSVFSWARAQLKKRRMRRRLKNVTRS